MADIDKFDVIVELKALTKKFNKKMTAASKQISKLSSVSKTSVSSIHDMNGRMVKFNAVLDSNGQILKKNLSITEDSRRRFKMYYLSMLFGGMMIKRTMESIVRSTMSTFMKITQGQTLASEGMTRLSVAWEYLKYSMGNALADALLPYIPTIVEFIGNISDFVSQHPDSVFWGIAGALAFGTVVLTIGQWGLFLDGLSRFVEAGIGFKFADSLMASSGAVGIFTLLGKAVLGAVGGLLLGILFAKAWKSNFMGIGTVINSVIGSMLIFVGVIVTAAKIVKEGLVQGFKFAFYRIAYYIYKITGKLLDMGITLANIINKAAKFLGLPTISTERWKKTRKSLSQLESNYWLKADTAARTFGSNVAGIIGGFNTFRGNVYRTYEDLTPAPNLNVWKMFGTPVMPSQLPQISQPSQKIEINIQAQGTDNEKLAKQIADQLDSALAKYGNLGYGGGYQ